MCTVFVVASVDSSAIKLAWQHAADEYFEPSAPRFADLVELTPVASVRGKGFHTRLAAWALAVTRAAGAGADKLALYPPTPAVFDLGLSVSATVYPDVAAAVSGWMRTAGTSTSRPAGTRTGVFLTPNTPRAPTPVTAAAPKPASPAPSTGEVGRLEEASRCVTPLPV